MLKLKFSKKATVTIVVFLIISGIFLWFVYLPKKDRLKQAKTKLESLQKELKDMEQLLSRGDSVADIMGASQEKRELLEEKFPSSEEVAITGISKLAAKYDISILSINSSVQDIDPVEELGRDIPGKEVKKASFNILILGSYFQLEEFLKELREDFEILVILDSLGISKSSTPDKLRVSMKLYLYLMV